MKISDWARGRPGLEIANPSDPRVERFFASSGMNDGGWGIELRRVPSIEESYRLQGAEVFYLVYCENPGKIAVIASITLRPVVRNGVKAKIATFGEARVAPHASPRAKAAIRTVYREILESFREIDELREVSDIYTVVLADNRDSLEAFARGRRGIRYASAAQIATVVRLALPISNRLWNLDGVSRKFRVEFTASIAPNPETDAIRDDFEAFDLGQAEGVRVLDSEGEEAANAVVWRRPLREIEIRKAPAAWRLALRLLGVGRSLSVRAITGFTWAEGTTSEKKALIQRAILYSAFESGRIRPGDLIMHVSEGATCPSFWTGGFPRLILSRVFRVSLDSEPSRPENPRIELDPVFL